jgi:uncharacterized damage-inducible protein DinB
MRAVSEIGQAEPVTTPFSEPVPFPEPTTPAVSRTEVFLRYLDYFRSRLAAKVQELPSADVRTSRVPSGWTPIEMVKHLTYVEMRWLEWGYEGHEVANPFADHKDDRWHVEPDETLAGLLDELQARGARTRSIIEAHDLDEPGQPGARWDGADPPPLERILFHLVQEYARHVGQLDIVAELAGTPVGE